MKLPKHLEDRVKMLAMDYKKDFWDRKCKDHFSTIKDICDDDVGDFYTDGFRAGVEAKGEDAKGLVKAVEDACGYYASAQICKHNCDPTVGFHEPECCIERALTKALTRWRKANDE